MDCVGVLEARERLGEDISLDVFCDLALEVDGARCDLGFDVVVASVDLLGYFRVTDRLCHLDSALIIVLDRHGRLYGHVGVC
jgi:hypothetical protein